MHKHLDVHLHTLFRTALTAPNSNSDRLNTNSSETKAWVREKQKDRIGNVQPLQHSKKALHTSNPERVS